MSEISIKNAKKKKKENSMYIFKMSLELISNNYQGIILALCKHFLSKR